MLFRLARRLQHQEREECTFQKHNQHFDRQISTPKPSFQGDVNGVMGDFVVQNEPQSYFNSLQPPQNVTQSFYTPQNVHQSYCTPQNVLQSYYAPQNVSQTSYVPQINPQSLYIPQNVPQSTPRYYYPEYVLQQQHFAQPVMYTFPPPVNY